MWRVGVNSNLYGHHYFEVNTEKKALSLPRWHALVVLPRHERSEHVTFTIHKEG